MVTRPWRTWLCEYKGKPWATMKIDAPTRSAARMAFARAAKGAGYGPIRQHLPMIRVVLA